MSDEFETLRELVSTRTGLHIRLADHDRFNHVMLGRIRAEGYKSPAAYLHFLQGPGAEREWRTLAHILVPGESHFFRDRGQVRLLENVILPDVIQQRRTTRRLRIWSAGCSTGEETYTLAMLLHGILRDELATWRVTLVGTDASGESIEHARTGLYGNWSFRQVEPALRDRLCVAEDAGWRVRPEIRSLATFAVHNLVNDAYPNVQAELFDLDLIVCRNVFIYFKSDMIAQIVSRMEDCLSVGGYFLTGHGELVEARPARLTVQVFPESLVYRRLTEPPPAERGAARVDVPAGARTPAQAEVPPVESGALRPPPAPPVESAALHLSPAGAPVAKAEAVRPGLESARALLRAGRMREAVDELRRVVSRSAEADAIPARYWLARALANSGNADEAAVHVQEILRVDSFHVRAYFLLAQLAEEGGDHGRAIELYKRAVYLDPDFVPAYRELGAIYERDGEHARAARLLTTARDLLKRLPPETEIEEYDHMTAAELLERLA